MSLDPTLTRLANATLLVPFESHHAPRWILEGLADGISGVCLFHNNLDTPEQITALNAELAQAADNPLISLDEEGGDVTRIGQEHGSDYPGNAALGAVDDPELTRATLRSLGGRLAQLGFNMNLAPSVDVNVADDNPVIGTRSFGSDAALVARHGAAAVLGLQEAGVAACAKHFPGHGATSQDSHHTLPQVEADPEVLHRRELAPFRAAVEAGVQSVLTAHIEMAGLGVTGPATLAPKVLNDLLRGELGFDGVIVSDAMDMHGVSGRIGIPEASVLAVAAGCDLLCLGRFVYADQVAAIRAALVEAVRDGRLPGERLEEAADRNLRLRSWIRDAAARRTAAAESAEVGLSGARRALRVTGELPALESPYVVEVDAPAGMAVGDVHWGLSSWFPDTERVSPDVSHADRLIAAAQGRDLVVVVRDAHRYPEARELVERLLGAFPGAVVVEMGLPVWRPSCGAHVSTYGAAHVNGRSAAELLGGVAPAVHHA
ncbi:glycoside hydrolase family 3 protein [Nocardiopsis changdeensis]|uniref:Glycoside hydrolase family 3 protein n=1 Tax=Nocardiopsis changdeensis TaxID=2831969 RepID=A0ABX8BH72_9ACTN|nr:MULTISPECIES: glycoside hydrolase family 3 N-terminal domain-containing protein [Nocardiopsis]QUX21461.1 glycoside hydrolase family 3 protein [Nocardiopsis changdeensis]QYX37394.1 glycoside hydrolase family 3 protein [Nocardiopsis sp. MT53]